MRLRTIAILSRKELGDALRNRWFVLYTLSFGALALAFSSAALLGSGQFGFASFGRTAASIVNLVLLVVPLMGLTAGATSIAAERERGTLAYLLAQPISRVDVFLGKFIGQAIALALSLTLGIGFSMAVLWWNGGGEQAGVLLSVLCLGVLLSTASLSLGLVLSTVCRASSAALGGAVFLWLLLAFGADLSLMAASFTRSLDIRTMFHLALLNPLSVFRMAAVMSLRSNLELLGPAGLYAAQTYGAWLLPLFGGALLAWIVLPLVGALQMFRWRDAV